MGVTFTFIFIFTFGEFALRKIRKLQGVNNVTLQN